MARRVTFMVRRPKVHRHPNGLPQDRDRCGHYVDRVGVLFPVRCRRARLRGSEFCYQHASKSLL